MQTAERFAETDTGTTRDGEVSGIEALRADAMMARLLDALEQKKDIGHYGRLVFAMMSEEELLDWLTQDSDFDRNAASSLIHQVKNRNYNPPRRERILEWQQLQDFQLIPNPNDPDAGNVYRDLKFPDAIYHQIEDYQEHK